MPKTVRRDPSKRDRDIRRSRERARVFAIMAHLAPKSSHDHYSDLEGKYSARVERALHSQRGRRG